WNDLQDNMSGRSIHSEDDIVIHKPLLDLDTNEYRKAERSKNDITARYARPGVLQACLILTSKSEFQRAAGRALKYDLAPRLRSTPVIPVRRVGASSIVAQEAGTPASGRPQAVPRTEIRAKHRRELQDAAANEGFYICRYGQSMEGSWNREIQAE